ncbi:MAG TPA: DUF423 domain-containing protein [bacterium]
MSAWVRLGAGLMAAGIALGAFGAHALAKTLAPELRQTYHTAVLYHLVHGLALVQVGALAAWRPGDRALDWAGAAFTAGIVLFSGSLYLISLTGVRRLGIITPFGGAAFLLGWLLLASAAAGRGSGP